MMTTRARMETLRIVAKGTGRVNLDVSIADPAPRPPRRATCQCPEHLAWRRADQQLIMYTIERQLKLGLVSDGLSRAQHFAPPLN
jgi:hypothetical protein